MGYITFEPLYQGRIWGGWSLSAILGRSLPKHQGPIGESWEVVDRPEAQSVALTPPYTGLTLRRLIEQHGEELMGPHWPSNKPFPILIKWLDCHERLSLQVHPPKKLALELSCESKCEHWYIAQAKPGAQVFAGLKAGVTQAAFEQALANHTLEQCLHRIGVRDGDSFFVPSGRLHAIDAGNLILEVQENADTTFRVYDWDRTDPQGKRRELHLSQSLRAIDFGDIEPKLQQHPPQEPVSVLAECSAFRIRRYCLRPQDPAVIFPLGQASLLSVVAGSIRSVGQGSLAGQTLQMGATALLPYRQAFTFEAVEPATFLVTDRFSR
jgi:mannose-6-phosphate isomerase